MPSWRSRLPPEHRQPLERLLVSLPSEVFRGGRQPRLGLPVLAVGGEGRGQQVGDEDRRRRTSSGDAALHRGLHGGVPAPQHARCVVGRRGFRNRCGAAAESEEARAAVALPGVDMEVSAFHSRPRRVAGLPPRAHSADGRKAREGLHSASILAWERAFSRVCPAARCDAMRES